MAWRVRAAEAYAEALVAKDQVTNLSQPFFIGDAVAASWVFDQRVVGDLADRVASAQKELAVLRAVAAEDVRKAAQAAIKAFAKCADGPLVSLVQGSLEHTSEEDRAILTGGAAETGGGADPPRVGGRLRGPATRHRVYVARVLAATRTATQRPEIGWDSVG